ncbi:MAG: glycosyltransferase family 4 protein [Chloroflexi bacterium]|nr:glycosyltransferase family 4 protein [Chloroflexota bacterium]MBU1749218.1 glycosyltransferase family 4 protein [Chloroflexota bacterium]MBU1879793.1 glycosyltransferase family 4 protein [Chloroflexota bacterium]
MIYLDVSAAVHGRAGLGRYAASLARALAARDPAQLALFYNQDAGTRPLAGLEDQPTRTVRAGYKPWRMAVWLGQLARLDYGRLVPGATLFHATEHLLLPLRRVPTVLTVHDLIWHLFPHHHKRLNRWFLDAAMPLFCRRATHIIAISECTRRDLVRLYGVPESKVTVVPEAAAPGFQPVPPGLVDEVRARYGLPARYAVTVGTIEPRKNLIRLADAVARLRAGAPPSAGGTDLRLVVVGAPGWLYDETLARLARPDVADAVIRPGFVPDEDLPAVYAGAVLCVQPSLYEGFGLPVLEAMACGAPVVCSNTSSLPEVGGDAARYFDPADPDDMARAIAAVWDDAGLRDTMRAAGLAQARQFSWDRAAAETLAVYQHTMGT